FTDCKTRRPCLQRWGEAPAEPQAQTKSEPGSESADGIANDGSAARQEPRPPGARSPGPRSQTDGTLYFFVMEYVDGANLRQLIEAGELAPETAIGIVPQLCEALQFAHDQGVVHRDIKPENILVDSRGQVKIADFGLARLTESSPRDFTLTGTHQVMGTPRYMAPEQMEGSRDVDHRADIYSLGVVFYEMLTGQVPAGHFDPPSKKVQIDVRLDEVVLRTLAREPERRYQQVSEVKTDVESISRTGVLTSEIPSTPAKADADSQIPATSLEETSTLPRTQKATPAYAANPNAEISRKAIAAAGVLFAGTIIFPILMLMADSTPDSDVALFLLSVLSLLALITAIGISALGRVAIDEIRRSDGQVRGLRLAFTDVVLCPAIALNFCITLVCLVLKSHGTYLATRYSGPGQFEFHAVQRVVLGLFPPAVIIAQAVISFRLLRSYWQLVSGPWPSEEEMANGPPREFCWKAAGALAISIVFVGLMLMMTATDGPSFLLESSIFTLGIAALISGVASCVIGRQAIRDIRESNGQLLGLPFAFAASAVLPIVLLDTAIFAVVFLAVREVAGLPPVSSQLSFAIMLSLPLWLIVDWLVLARQWSIEKSRTNDQSDPGSGPGPSDGLSDFADLSAGDVATTPEPPARSSLSDSPLPKADSGGAAGRDPTHMKWSLVPFLGVVGVSIFSFVADGALWAPHWQLRVADSWVPLTLLWCGDGLVAFFAFRFAYRSSRLEWKLAAFVLTLISLLGVVYAVLLLGQILRRHEAQVQPRRRRGDSAIGWFLAYLLLFAVPGIWRELTLSQDSGMGELVSSDRGAKSRKPAALLDLVARPNEQSLPINLQLLKAAVESDVENAKKLLQEGADPNTVARVSGEPVSGRTPLMIAAAGGHAPLVALLLMQGGEPKIQDTAGQTALMLAAVNSHANVVRVIFEICDQKFGNQVVFRDHLRRKADAADSVFKRTDIPAVPTKLRPVYIPGLFIKSGEELQDSKGETALMKAAAAGDAESVKLLSGAGRPRGYSDLKALQICEMQDKAGRTAFMHAVLGGNKELILEACRTESDFPKVGTNQLSTFCHTSVLSIRDGEGNSALDLASSGDPEIQEAIRHGLAEVIAWANGKLAGGVYLTNLQIPLRQRADAYSALGEIEKSKADYNFREQLDQLDNPTLAGRTFALFEAAAQGNATLVKKQLAEKVDPNSKNPAGETPLMKAVESGDLQTVVVLIFRGADEQAKDKLGQTPLMRAAAAGKAEVVKLLLEMERLHTDPQLQFRLTRLDSDLPLNTDFTKMRFDSDGVLKDNLGQTAIFKAVLAESLECTLPLIRKTGSQTRDKAGLTPLMHAVEAKSFEFLKQVAEKDTWSVYIGSFRQPSSFFYGNGVSGTKYVGDDTVLLYLEKNGATEAAGILREKILRMIDKCSEIIENPKSPSDTQEALIQRAKCHRELGMIEEAQSDEKVAAELNKLPKGE
ncbi:MAG: ankyrin repeat domain-containing protein, partial [Planctomycetes bacterium]|nr:ankyrin repeat domain-containing protein [Planctomycetota bacterium]